MTLVRDLTPNEIIAQIQEPYREVTRAVIKRLIKIGNYNTNSLYVELEKEFGKGKVPLSIRTVRRLSK